ncbi:MAG: hypothetical protein ACE15F_21870 [bacterium]
MPLPMLKNGSPAAYVMFSPIKQTAGLAMINPEGSTYAVKTHLGFQGITPGEDSKDKCLYFQAASDQIALATGTFFVTISYLDKGKGAVQLDYNALDKDGQPGVRSDRFFLGDSGYWLQHTFTLAGAVLNHSFPAETDFRIFCPEVLIRAAALTRFPPQSADQATSPIFRQPGVILPPAYSFGVMVDDGQSNPMWEKESILEEKARLYHAWGAPFAVTTINAAPLETARGSLDFSLYAERAKKLAQWNLGWIPRFKIGDVHALPSQALTGLQRAVGTETPREGPMISLWDPKLSQLYGRVFQEMRQTSGLPPFSRMILSFAGDWGPLYLSMEDPGQSGWPDFWAGDPLAVVHFQNYLRTRYGSLTALRTVWRSSITGWNEGNPVLSSGLPAARKLDTLTWYRSSLAALAKSIVEQARAHFPQTEILIETGDDFLYGATDARLLAMVASETQSSLLMATGEPLPTASVYWQWLAGIANRLGVKFGLRYAGRGGGEAVMGYLYSLASEGGTLFYFPEEMLAGQNAWQQYADGAAHLMYARPQPRVALIFPRTSLAADAPQAFIRLVSEYREYFGFDVIDEEDLPFISAAEYPLIFVPWGTLWTNEAIAAFENLVRGGALLAVHADQPWMTLNGETAFNERLFAARVVQAAGGLRYELLRDQPPLANPADALPSSREVLNLGTPGDDAFLAGQWGLPQNEAAAKRYGLPFPSFRWLGEHGRVLLSAQPGQEYRLEIEGFLPRGKRAQVMINRRPFAEIEGSGPFKWNQVLRGEWRPRQREVEVALRGQEWSTGEVLGATQTFRVSMAVSRIGLVPVKESVAREEVAGPVNPSVPQIGREQLRGSVLREVGRGFTLLAPGGQINDYVFREILTAIAANPAVVDPRYRFTLPPDGAPNGVYVKPLQTGNVYANLRTEPMTVGITRANPRGRVIPPHTLLYAR